MNAASQLDGSAPSQSSHLPSLTVIRGFLALLVVIHNHKPSYNFFLPAFAVQFANRGYLAVDVFFLLSGLVLTHVYANSLAVSQPRQVRNFLVHRFARIYPIYFVALLLFLVFELAKFVAHGRWHTFSTPPFSKVASLTNWIAGLFMVQSWGFMGETAWNPPAWSVSSEWLAYLLAPLMIPFLHHRLRGVTLRIFVTIILVSALTWVMKQSPLRSFDQGGGYGTLRCLVGFTVGIFAYRLAMYLAVAPRYMAWLAVAVFVVGGLATVYAKASDALIYPCGASLLAACAGLDMARKDSTEKPIGFLQYAGEISYSVYIIHWLFVLVWLATYKRVLGHFHPLGQLACFIVHLAIIYLFAVAAHRCIEKPGRTWLRKLEWREP